MLIRTGCHSSSGRWQVATCDAVHPTEHGMQGAWPSGWECQWVSAMTQLRGEHFWAMDKHRETQNYVCLGMPWAEVKGQCSRDYNERSGRTAMTPCGGQIFPFSLLLPTLGGAEHHCGSFIESPREPQEWAGWSSCNCLYQHSPPKKLFYFLLQNLILGNSVFYYFGSEFLQVFELKLTWLLFSQMSVAFVCMMLSLLV